MSVLGRRGVIRSCRVQPPAMSRPIRAPGPTAANIDPYTAIAVMKYSGKLVPLKVACRCPDATPKNRTSGSARVTT